MVTLSEWGRDGQEKARSNGEARQSKKQTKQSGKRTPEGQQAIHLRIARLATILHGIESQRAPAFNGIGVRANVLLDPLPRLIDKPNRHPPLALVDELMGVLGVDKWEHGLQIRRMLRNLGAKMFLLREAVMLPGLELQKEYDVERGSLQALDVAEMQPGDFRVLSARR